MLHGITYLRGVAALAVVLLHLLPLAQARTGFTLPFGQAFLAGGVDLFFVISGFIMVHATRPNALGVLDRREFLARRVARIGPLYWLITAAVFAAFLAHPAVSSKPLDWPTFVRSMLFVPTDFSYEMVVTIISVGWTLCYEMFFYGLFALVFGFSYRHGVKALTAIMVLLAALHPLVSGDFYAAHYTSPLLLEFASGMWIANITAPRRPLLVIALGAVWMIFMDRYFGARELAYGVGAFLVVWGAVHVRIDKPLRALVLLGDASYSLYLVHMYVLQASFKLYSGVGAALVALAVTVLASMAIHLWVEKPLSKRALGVLLQLLKVDRPAGRPAVTPAA